VLNRGDAARWVDDHCAGAPAEEALAVFDDLPAVLPADLTGRWRGSGLPTGSPLDGLLEAHGWYGKEFIDAETAHPLLFRDARGRPRPVDPAFAPVDLLRARPGLAHTLAARVGFRVVRPLRYTRRPSARVRAIEHRGVVTAALVYDALPVIDVFRRVTDDVLLGAMDLRGLEQPFFFLLHRDRSGPAGRPPEARGGAGAQ
jgi:hypothetical protein